jgi:hypothetical protein
MRAMIKAAAAAAVLLMATPALALTPETSPSPAGLAGARFLSSEAALTGPTSGLQAALVGSGLRTDGEPEFSGDSATSYGYLTSAEPADPAKTVVERYFEDELATYRVPGTTVNYATAPGVQVVATPQGK